jgi:hypothetical protein
MVLAGKRGMGVSSLYGDVLQRELAQYAGQHPTLPASRSGFWTSEMEPEPCALDPVRISTTRGPWGPACHAVEVNVDEPNLLWGAVLPERITIWTTPVVWSDPGYRALITRLTTDKAAVCAAAAQSPHWGGSAPRFLRCAGSSGPSARVFIRVIPSLARECSHPSPGATLCKERSASGSGAVRIG